jgi:steroid delta-isomerase-like uncharacterized protein
MTQHDNETQAHAWHLEVIQNGKLDLADHILASNVTAHVNGQEFQGLEGARGLAQALKSAFPDVTITHHEAISSGDAVAIRWSSKGTQRGEYFGMAASNNPVSFEGIDWFHFKDGKISEMWIEFDNLGVTQQIGGSSQP